MKTRPYRRFRDAPPPDLDPSVPVTLTGQVTLTSGSPGALNNDALKNPLGVPLEIREIKWSIAATIPSVTAQFATFAGDAVDISLSYGPDLIPITNSPIPLYNLGHTTDPLSDVPPLSVVAISTTNIPLGVAFGVWKLDEPLYLLPGEGLQAQLKHRGAVAGALIVTISISGAAVKSVPATRMIPYVAGYTANSFDMNSSATVLSQSSTERDIVNTTAADVDVRRLIGRLVIYSYVVLGIGKIPAVIADPITLHGIRDSLINIGIRSYQGIPVATANAAGVPFGSVFPIPFHAIEIRHRLAPGGYYLVQLDETPMADDFNYQANASISLIGYRELQS